MVFAVAMSADAQLGLPTTTVKDTLDISKVYYNGTELNRADWPDTVIVEDALSVYIANHVYVKGRLKETMKTGRHYDATCNGKTVPLVVKRSVSELGELSYTIGEYVFWVRERKQHSKDGERYMRRRGGTGFSLAGRSARSLPTPAYDGDKEGKVVVKIWVDRYGDVVNAECSEIGSTLTDTFICNASKAAAMRARFNAKESAPETQTGTITYVFRRN